jgi:dTDP-4-dehydrorhamnose reductase
MRVLLLGANGQVGHELRRALADYGDIVCTTRSGHLDDGQACETADLDLPASLPALVDRVAPDIVVNAAAYTAVDRAESEPAAAFRANAEAPAALASACAACNALLVHYSTDYVFDGAASRPWREDDPVGPLNVYGRSKLAGEEAIRASGARHMILRTAWVYADRGQNFMLTILRLAREREELRVVADQTGSPTPAALVADTTRAILDRPPAESGIWHLATAGGTSWHGFAEAVLARALRVGRIQRTPRVVPIPSSEHPTPARRPACSRLDCSRLERELGLGMPSWEAALGTVLL